MWSAYETHLRHDIHSRSHQLIEQLHGGLHPRSLSTLAGAVPLVNQAEPPGKTGAHGTLQEPRPAVSALTF